MAWKIRYVWRFLLFPLCINDETRWMQWALLRQSRYWSGWRTVEFAKIVHVPND